VVNLPNDYLVYALTWFALAGMAIFAMPYLVKSSLPLLGCHSGHGKGAAGVIRASWV
jgi:hypothetical protein